MAPPMDQATAKDGLAFKGKHWRLWVSLDGVVRGILEGDHDAESLEPFLEAIGEIGDKVQERPVRLLFYANRALRLTPEARERLISACRAHVLMRVALVRASPLTKIQARAIARHSGHEFFFLDNEREALQVLGVADATKPKKETPPPMPKYDVGIVDHVT